MYLSSNYMWSFLGLFHILVPPPVLLLVWENQPLSLSCSSRRPFMTLLVNLIWMSFFRSLLHSSMPESQYWAHDTMIIHTTCLFPPWDYELLRRLYLIHLYNPSPVCMDMWVHQNGWIDDIWAGLWESWSETQLRMGQVGEYLTSRRAFWAAQYQARLTREASFWSDRGRKLRIYVSIWGKKTGHWGLLELEVLWNLRQLIAHWVWWHQRTGF